MSHPVLKPKLNSHVYLSVLFTVLSYILLPIIASFVGVLSGRSALHEIEQQPDKFYGRQAATICIYASYFSAVAWFCLIVGYIMFNITHLSMV